MIDNYVFLFQAKICALQ